MKSAERRDSVTAETPESAAASLPLTGHFIAGKEVAGSGGVQDVFDPAAGVAAGRVRMADRATVEQAIAAASAAAPDWTATPPQKRARIMFRFRELLEQHADEICRVISKEHGKVLNDARGELQRGIEVVEYACGIAELLKGEHSREAGPGIDSWSELQPLGVVAGITPFNFPVMVPMWMYPLAICCGNSFVLKPSERDPGASLLVARLLQEAGLPDGVFNVVNGGREAVETLLDDERVQAVSFVGSTAVAESIYRRATAAGKRVQALGGAKNHAVVLPDADLDAAADALMGAAYGSCGQRCMAISVAVTVGEETGNELVDLLRSRIADLKVGPGNDNSNDMGPLVSKESLERIHGYIDQGLAQGAELAVDGRGLTVSGNEGGFFIGACLFDRVQPQMTIYRDEIFGPVLCVVRAENFDQAVALVNEHEYGNGAALFTRDGEAARHFSNQVKIGMVGINVALPVPVASQSFGGWKRSLFGDHYAYGPDAIRFYTRRKTMTQRWLPRKDDGPAGPQFSFPSSGS
ncbi:MAG: CoA-acylating methylmalonate-semialdehyde dehydrogenase [Gammaproteobacteria bacterium]|nr:CoA-acylating methylmalonate-semialdehyde dehydrogenase [Gammaproteobacteria bacterium]MYE30155.1 CoA-acylating methylmalonate-semialdehyde dehydrogenase [Gammaproteobacteria bacterium]